ncbi:phage recombination protein Bet [Vibrio cholerae]|nr:phage recombination protein Bet [Vibrio cholerae]EGR4298028.1 phage recombination protein Bet [Vibrio cholerae]ELJ8607144.1 phage recombination protein Bet [Vibrio cholerae]
MSTALIKLADRLNVDGSELQNIILNTIMPAGKQVTQEQFVSFISVANEYKLNPLTKEIYAFPAKSGGIQPIVSIDGWLKIINQHPDFDGMEFKDNVDEAGKLISITCRIYRKGRTHPTEMTEYMSECSRPTDTWKQWPSRMLRHKATIQAARYAFGLSGIIDPDEAERYQESGAIEKDITPEKQTSFYPQDDFDKNFPAWEKKIKSGTNTPERIIAMVQSRGQLTDEMKQRLFDASAINGELSHANSN